MVIHDCTLYEATTFQLSVHHSYFNDAEPTFITHLRRCSEATFRVPTFLISWDTQEIWYKDSNSEIKYRQYGNPTTKSDPDSMEISTAL